MPKTWATIRKEKKKRQNFKEELPMEMNTESAGERKLQCSDVTKCFELLESILDGDMTQGGKAIMDDKLAKCQPCFEHYHLEQAIREVLKTKCTKQAVPSELSDSIRRKIQDIK